MPKLRYSLGAIGSSAFIPDAGDLGYYPIAAGETAGNITNYEYPVRNVKRYGAIGNDIADDTTAIQRAVTACNGAGGGTVVFPDGTYKTSAAINLGTVGNISLVARGRATLHPTVSTQRGVTCGGPISNVLIDGLNIIGSGFSNGFVFVPVTNLQIRNLTVSGANQTDPTLGGITAGIFCGFATNVVIDNCDFSNNGHTVAGPQTLGDDINMGGNGGVGDVQQNIIITRCRCKSTAVLRNIGLFDCSDVLVQGCDVSGAIVDAASNTRGGYGVMLYNTTSNPDSVHHNRVLGNTIKNTQGTGVYFQGSDYSIASGNILRGTASAQDDVSLVVAAISLASCWGSAAVANIINDVYVSAVSVADSDGTFGNNTVSSNTINNVMPQTVGGIVRPCIYLRGVINRVGVIGNEISNTSSLSGIGGYDNGAARPIQTGLRIIGNQITGARVVGTGTVTSTAGVTVFSQAQVPALANGDKVLVGLVSYTISGLAGLACTLAATVGGASPTFAATSFILPKNTTGNSFGICLLGVRDSIIEGNYVENVSAQGIRCTDGTGGGSATARVKVVNNTVIDANALPGGSNYGIQVQGIDCIISGNHSTSGTLAQQYGGIVAVGAGTMVFGNHTRPNNTNYIAVSGGAVEWGNFTGANNSQVQGTLPFVIGSKVQGAQTALAEAVLLAGVDASIANSGVVTLTNNRLVGQPALAGVAGQRYTFTFIQDATGGRAVTWNTTYFKGLTWSDTGNTANKRSSISFIWDGTEWNQDGAQTPYAT